MNAQILEAIEESELNRSAQIQAALAANQRIKYSLSLLQVAVAAAEHPEQPPTIPQAEHSAGGVDGQAVDRLIRQTRREQG
jgi:hypothetical protein